MQSVLNTTSIRQTSIGTVRKAVKFALEDEIPLMLSNVTWETYEEFIQENMDKFRSPRFYFEKGKLLIMPTSEHEGSKDTIVYLINILTEEFKINARSLGSTTYQREDIERGFEPDSCFYFANEPKIRGVKRIDMTIHPAPDLIIEVDITSSSEMRERIFAAFGVPEIWRFDGEKVVFLQLKNGEYEIVEKSLNLPLVSAEIITEFIRTSETSSRLEWLENVRNWARNAS